MNHDCRPKYEIRRGIGAEWLGNRRNRSRILALVLAVGEENDDDQS
jgi:hypothetical protein